MTTRCHRRLGLAGIVAGLAAAAGCLPPPAADPTAAKELPTVTVTLASVATRPVERSVTAVGTLYGYDEAAVGPKVAGKVTRVPVDLGDVVQPGQVLLELDPREYQAKVDSARSMLLGELGNLRPKAGTFEEALAGLVPPAEFDPEKHHFVTGARAELAQAAADKARAEGAGGSMSPQERQLAVTKFAVAEAGVPAAVARARVNLSTAWQRKADLEAAELTLEDCTLRAPTPTGWAGWAAVVGPGLTPFRYKVALKTVSEGEAVQPMTGANKGFKLVIDTALKLPVPIPDRFRPDVQIGQPVEVRVDAYPDRAFAGTVYQISPTSDPANRTFYAVVAVPNLDGRLKAGGFARATVKTGVDPTVRTVPPAALVTFAGVTKVFAVADGKAKAVEVRLGSREKDWVEVVSDLPAGTQVATSGASQLVDGSPVKIRQ